MLVLVPDTLPFVVLNCLVLLLSKAWLQSLCLEQYNNEGNKVLIHVHNKLPYWHTIQVKVLNLFFFSEDLPPN